jgi:hypothetical protein
MHCCQTLGQLDVCVGIPHTQKEAFLTRS